MRRFGLGSFQDPVALLQHALALHDRTGHIGAQALDGLFGLAVVDHAQRRRGHARRLFSTSASSWSMIRKMAIGYLPVVVSPDAPVCLRGAGTAWVHCYG